MKRLKGVWQPEHEDGWGVVVVVVVVEVLVVMMLMAGVVVVVVVVDLRSQGQISSEEPMMKCGHKGEAST